MPLYYCLCLGTQAQAGFAAIPQAVECTIIVLIVHSTNSGPAGLVAFPFSLVSDCGHMFGAMKLTISLSEKEGELLTKVAQAERRQLPDQAAHLVAEGLLRRL